MPKYFILFIFLLSLSARADVIVSDSTYTLKRYYDGAVHDSNFTVKVLENDYVRIFLLPQFGGRVMSLYSKESQTEQFYRADIARRYGGGTHPFYYNKMLEVPGGVFSTFPFNEHGYTWNIPWTFEELENTSKKASYKMSFQLENHSLLDPNNPDKLYDDSYIYNNNLNDAMLQLKCEITVSLEAGSNAFSYDIVFTNTTEQPVGEYEYWTVTTFSPGSQTDSIFSPPNTLILVPTEKVSCIDWGGGLCSGTQGIQGTNEYYYEPISKLGDWKSEGILYAEPNLEDEWWGAINLDNSIGVLRISDNKNITPGIKYWTWGEPSTHPENWEDLSLGTSHKRPHIELWAGHGHHFGDRQSMAAGDIKAWSEIYYTTFELDTIHFANEFGAVELRENGNMIQILYSSTHPEQVHEMSLGMTRVEVQPPPGKAVIVEATKGCFAENASLSILMNSKLVLNFDIPENYLGSEECNATIIQGKPDVLSSSSEVGTSSETDIGNLSSGDAKSSSSEFLTSLDRESFQQSEKKIIWGYAGLRSLKWSRPVGTLRIYTLGGNLVKKLTEPDLGLLMTTWTNPGILIVEADFILK